MIVPTERGCPLQDARAPWRHGRTLALLLCCAVLGLVRSHAQEVVVHYNTDDCYKSMRYLRYLVGRLSPSAEITVIADRNKRDFLVPLFAERPFTHEHLRVVYTIPSSAAALPVSWVEIAAGDTLVAEGPISQADDLVARLPTPLKPLPPHVEEPMKLVLSDRVELYSGGGEVAAMDYVFNRCILFQAEGDPLIPSAWIVPEAGWSDTLLARHGIDHSAYDAQRGLLTAFGSDVPVITSAAWKEERWWFGVTVHVPRTVPEGGTGFYPLQFLVNVDRAGAIERSIYLNWLPFELGGPVVRDIDQGWTWAGEDLVLPMDAVDDRQRGCLAVRCSMHGDSLIAGTPVGCALTPEQAAAKGRTQTFASNGLIAYRNRPAFYDPEREQAFLLELPTDPEGKGRCWTYDIAREGAGWKLLYWNGKDTFRVHVDRGGQVTRIVPLALEQVPSALLFGTGERQVLYEASVRRLRLWPGP